MSETQEYLMDFDELIVDTENLKHKLAVFPVRHKGLSIKNRATLSFLESAADHILVNLNQMGQRILINLKEQ